MQLHQARDNNTHTVEPAVAEDKVAEHGATEEKTEAAIKLEHVSVKQIMTV
jgi:hypothetical protein